MKEEITSPSSIARNKSTPRTVVSKRKAADKSVFYNQSKYSTTKTADGRNRRSVWTVATRSYKGAHFATYPPALIEPCILAGSRPGDTVLDPFGGSGTTAGVAVAHGRSAILCELNPGYAAITPARVQNIIDGYAKPIKKARSKKADDPLQRDLIERLAA